MANPQDRLICTECQSTFFWTARAEQFLAGGYGSAEFRSISAGPKTVLICVGCGTPATPKAAQYARGTQAHLDEDAFRKSIENGRKHRKESSLSHVATIAASPAEVQEVRDDIAEVRKAIYALANPPVIQPQEQPKPVEHKSRAKKAAEKAAESATPAPEPIEGPGV